MSSITEELAAAAARLVVDEGMEYAQAKRKASRGLGQRVELPSNEQVEDAVREHIALFCADTQPAELHALREVALLWMRRLAEFRPHLSGAAWRGTATRLAAVLLDLYCDDAKMAEIALINAGENYDSGALDRPGQREPLNVLTVATTSRALGELVTVHLLLHDADDQRGALKPDARGRSWRGDIQALQRLVHADAQADRNAGVDAGTDPGTNAGTNASTDAGTDARTNAVTGAAPDAGTGAGKSASTAAGTGAGA